MKIQYNFKIRINVKNMKDRNFIIIVILVSTFIISLIYVNRPKALVYSDTMNSEPMTSWLDTELMDVKTNKTFKISDFKGKTVLLESFAVWCPTCLKQQNEIKKIHDEKGDEIIHIALDTDPNEDKAKVLDYIYKNKFNWFYAISPIEMTRELSDKFGLAFINAPSAPVVLICPDQTSRFLKKGLKKSDELLSEIERGCSV